MVSKIKLLNYLANPPIEYSKPKFISGINSAKLNVASLTKDCAKFSNTLKINININTEILKRPSFQRQLKSISTLKDDEFVHKAYSILKKEFGIEDIAPKLEIVDKLKKSDGNFDKYLGKLQILRGKDNAFQLNTLAHELKHFEQTVDCFNICRAKQNSIELAVLDYLWCGTHINDLKKNNVDIDFYRKIAKYTDEIKPGSLKYKTAKKILDASSPFKHSSKPYSIKEQPAYKVGDKFEKYFYTQIEGNSTFKWILRSLGF